MECDGNERRHRLFLVSKNIAVSYRSPSLRRDGSDERRPYLQDNILRFFHFCLRLGRSSFQKAVTHRIGSGSAYCVCHLIFVKCNAHDHDCYPISS